MKWQLEERTIDRIYLAAYVCAFIAIILKLAAVFITLFWT